MSTSLFNQALRIRSVAKKSGLRDLPKVPIAAQVECSIGRRGCAENGLLERAAVDEHGVIFGGPHDVNDAVLVDAEKQTARGYERGTEIALEPKLTEHLARL